MSLTSWALDRYQLPCTIGEYNPREGLILTLKGTHGHVGLGEIAPLPGLHPETLPTATAKTLEWLAEPKLPVPQTLPSTVRFGIGCALWSLQASVEKTPPWSDPQRSTIRLNALVTHQGTLHAANRAAREGYTTLKIKVGRRSVPEDVARLRAVQSAMGPDVQLRIDANRAWSLEQAVAFCRGIDGIDNVEYLEEPLKEPQDLGRLFQETGRPLAVDETARELPLKDALSIDGVSHVVVKPTTLGTPEDTLSWTDRAREFGVEPVLSASFESGIGLSALGWLAAKACAPQTACGLATSDWLEEDVVQPPVRPRLGQLPLQGPSFRLRQDLLQRVAHA